MVKEFIKKFVNGTFNNIAGEFIKNYSEEQNNSNLSNILEDIFESELKDMDVSFEKILRTDDVSDKKFEELLQKMDIPDEYVPALIAFRKGISYFTKLLEDSFEVLHDSICSIDYQMHTDKIERAKQARKQFERALNTMNPSEEIKSLLRDFDGAVISNLYSDMKGKVDEIKERSRKKRPFGYIKVGRDLKELRETIPVYVDTIFLISWMRLYLGELSNAQSTIKDAQEKLKTLFPYEIPDENRMYTLTDEDDWLKVPRKYCDEFEKYLHQIEFLSVTKCKLAELH